MSEVTFEAVTADTVWLSYDAHHTTLQKPLPSPHLDPNQALTLISPPRPTAGFAVARVWQSVRRKIMRMESGFNFSRILILEAIEGERDGRFWESRKTNDPQT